MMKIQMSLAQVLYMFKACKTKNRKFKAHLKDMNSNKAKMNKATNHSRKIVIYNKYKNMIKVNSNNKWKYRIKHRKKCTINTR